MHTRHTAAVVTITLPGIHVTLNHGTREYFIAVDGSTACKTDIRTILTDLSGNGYVLLDETESPAEVTDRGVRIWMTNDRWEMMC